ncbi:DsbA family protein [Pseudonocardia dioxanivorans]|uniref:DsbA family protein n=1 Tax=Pseudonocardia dioxanivorans TaxID=240495 RepID=UPI000CD11659|nr:thioredoxin domain-containing protein [Pseudonocardia dioxanivorans]
MTRNAKVSVGIVVAVALVAALVWALLPDRSPAETVAAPQAAPPTATVDRAQAAAIAARPDSRRLSDGGGGRVTFVEFLDFECEACGALFPTVEQLRRDYGDRVTFVVRYFPLPNHMNAERAARAVEAAAQQGRFEQMYTVMFERQTEWGEQQEPKDVVFRGYAAELGLDMSAWDRAYAAPTTLDRVRADVADGTTLGVAGTPSFFLDGNRLRPQTVQDLRSAIDAALAGGGVAS